MEKNYQSLLGEIKARIRSAQYAALRAVNKELTGLYWDIGWLIVHRQQGKTWGKSIVTKLAKDLHLEFPGIKGFSEQNLWRMRQFFEAYHAKPKLSPLVREIAWSQNLIILMRCKTDAEKAFYLRKVIEHGWSKNVLILQIEAKGYRKALTAQTNFNRTLPVKIQGHLKHAVKDEYTFDFLELNDEYNEKQLELAILAKVEPFLREMGGIFSFVGSQFRLEIKGREYFIDLLLYHRHLRCLVAIELKVGEFMPEHVGKVQFYLAALDSQVKTREENPSIGIILCKSKDRTIVEYALRESKKPIGVATYRVLRKLPKKLRKELPRPQQVEMLLDALPAKTLTTGERNTG